MALDANNGAVRVAVVLNEVTRWEAIVGELGVDTYAVAAYAASRAQDLVDLGEFEEARNPRRMLFVCCRQWSFAELTRDMDGLDHLGRTSLVAELPVWGAAPLELLLAVSNRLSSKQEKQYNGETGLQHTAGVTERKS